MVELIVAMDLNGGIGNSNRLPWHIPQELSLFRAKTMGKTLVMGRKTFDNLPPLVGRTFIRLSRSQNTFDDIRDHKEYPHNIMIAGGAQIYKEALSRPNYVKRAHVSVIDKVFDCDTHFHMKWLDNFVIVETHKYPDFTHYVMDALY